MRVHGNRTLALAFAGIALLLAATLVAYRTPAPLGLDAAPGVFSAGRARSILAALVGSGVPHPIGSPANLALRETLVGRLRAMGYATQLQTGLSCNDGVCGIPINIIASLGPIPKDRDAVLLAAHYDSVPAGPGASDDGAAVASLLEIARILAARPAPRHPVILLLTDGEEAGLLGALLFVREHPLARAVKAAVNMEARGTSGPSLMFETGSANSWLMRMYDSVIARPITNSLYYVVYKLLPNDTDFTVFKAAAYQGFNFAFIGNVGRYHTPLDNVANASAGSIQHQGDNALASLLALANSASLTAPASDAVFFDVFGRTLCIWPAAFAAAAAVVCLLLLLGQVFLWRRAGVVATREILWGGLGSLCMLGVGVALSSGLLALYLALGRIPPLDAESWNAQPLPMHCAAAAIAFLVAGATGHWLARRAGFWGFWAAAALLIALLSAVSAVLIPGASFVWLLTAIASALAALPCTISAAQRRSPPPWAPALAALLPTLVFFAAVIPVLRFLYAALGSLGWPVNTVVLCLGTATLLPLLAAATRQMRRAVIASAALTTIGGALLTLALPTYSADWPQRINLEYWLDADSGQAHYLARCDSRRLPATLAAAAHFDPAPHPRFAGSAAPAFHADAPATPLAAPELTLTGAPTAAVPGVTHFELRLRSARGAPEALVVFPAGAQVDAVEFATAAAPLQAKLGKLKAGATLLDLVGLPAEGVQFSIDAAGSLPLVVQVFDQSYAFAHSNLLRARAANATSSQDGDLTVVHRTVSLDPAADR
ncbi:MAG TPA: M28 family peptidase [Steroidobacteraceae bacterium]